MEERVLDSVEAAAEVADWKLDQWLFQAERMEEAAVLMLAKLD